MLGVTMSSEAGVAGDALVAHYAGVHYDCISALVFNIVSVIILFVLEP